MEDNDVELVKKELDADGIEDDVVEPIDEDGDSVLLDEKAIIDIVNVDEKVILDMICVVAEDINPGLECLVIRLKKVADRPLVEPDPKEVLLVAVTIAVVDVDAVVELRNDVTDIELVMDCDVLVDINDMNVDVLVESVSSKSPIQYSVSKG